MAAVRLRHQRSGRAGPAARRGYRRRRPTATGRRASRRGAHADRVPVYRRDDPRARAPASTGPAIVEERETDRGDPAGLVRSRSVTDGSLVATRGRGSARESSTAFDPIELEVLWQSLIATVNEQAKALQRAAFSPIVREAGDLANAVFDRRARMVAQAVTGTPGHINSLAIGAAAILAEYPPDSLVPGDVLITNDPYKTAGQLLDVTVLVPVFKGRGGSSPSSAPPSTTPTSAATASAPVAGTCSRKDSGSPSASSTWPGERNPDVWKFILSNVRQPDHMAGDLHAQVASGEVGSQRLLALCDAARAGRHRGSGRRDHQPFGGGHPGLDPPASRRHVPLARAARPGRRLAASTSTCALTIDADAGEVHGRLRRLVRGQPVRDQRREELHPRVHDVRGAQRAEPGDPEQPRQPGARSRSRRRRAASSTRCRPQPGTARHVVGMFLPERAAEGAGPGQARAGHGRGVRRGLDDAGQRQPRRRPPVHHGHVHLRRRRRRPGRQARACRPAPTRPAWPRCRSRWSRPARRSGSTARQLRPGSGGARRADRRAGPDDRVLRRHRPARGSSTPSPAGWPCAPEGIFGGEPGAAGSLLCQRRARHDTGQGHPAAR